MSNAKDYHTSLPGYFSTTEAAEFLGYRNSDTLRKLCAEGKLTCYKVGKTWLLPVEQVEMLDSQEVSPYGNRGQARK